MVMMMMMETSCGSAKVGETNGAVTAAEFACDDGNGRRLRNYHYSSRAGQDDVQQNPRNSVRIIVWIDHFYRGIPPKKAGPNKVLHVCSIWRLGTRLRDGRWIRVL